MNDELMEAPRKDAGHDQVEPWIDRAERFPGSPPSFADSPLAKVWARADASHVSAVDEITRLRAERRHAAKAEAEARHWPRLKTNRR